MKPGVRTVGVQYSGWESGMDAKLEAFRDLCRRASIETDPAELESLKDALRFMLRTEELNAVEKKPGLKPN